MATKNLVRSIITQQISLAFGLTGQRIPRKSKTVIEIPNGVLTINGENVFMGTAWAVYEGMLGKWQANISPSLRVGSPQALGD